MATFNIGQQNAASIQNIGGNATIEGGLHAEATWETLELRRTIARTREEVARLVSRPRARESERVARRRRPRGGRERPDRYEVGERLAAAAHTLKEAGALAGAGTGVVQALRRAVELLGPAGLATIAPAL